MTRGKLIGVGVGPGDPDLLTVKAVEAIRATPVLAFFAKKGRRSIAREIAAKWIPEQCVQVPLYYPITTEAEPDSPEYVSALEGFYEAATAALAQHLDAGRDVSLLAEGDPLFYGSFMHLYVRLRERFSTSIIPGVSGMSGCWTVAGEPMTWGDDVLTVLTGMLPEEELVTRLKESDAAVIMKTGRNFSKVRRAIERAGLLSRAIYVERGTMHGEVVVKLEEKGDGAVPYFALILIPSQRTWARAAWTYWDWGPARVNG